MKAVMKPTLKIRRVRPCVLMLPAMVAAAFPIAAAHAEDTAEPSTKLPTVTITGTNDDLSINAEAGAGFRNDKAHAGILGVRDLQDTPYSITVIDSTMIENTDATSLTDVMKYMPSTQMEARGGLDVGRPQSRGMEGSVVGNSHLDGFNVVATTALPIDLYDRVEVINSLTGALYGPANPAGDFEFYSKRSTDKPLRKFTLSYGDGQLAGVHVDLGGKVDDSGIVGYRINALHQEGEGYVSDSKLRRDLASLALDVRFTPDAVLELSGSHYAFKKTGYSGGFSYAQTLKLPGAPDPTDTQFTAQGVGPSLRTDTGTALFKYRLADNWNVQAGIARQAATRDLDNVSTKITQNTSGDYVYTTTASTSSAASIFSIVSNQVRLNGQVTTGAFKHDLVIATTGYTQNTYSTYKTGSTWQQTFMLGDTVDFGEHWSGMAVASYSRIHTRSYTATGAATGTPYDEGGASPTVALMYKFTPTLSTYVAYADSLQQGDTASSTAENAYETLAPYRSKQVEAGVKWRVNGINTSAALFRIQRPFAYTGDDNIYAIQGNQVNKGLELMANGEVVDGVGIYSGLTLLNPKLEDTALAATSGKEVVGVPKVQGNILAEYRVDQLPGLVVNGNVHYTGKRAANSTNSTWAKGYTTLDLGARYTTKVWGKETVFRLTAKNVTNEHYWAAIFYSDINSASTSTSPSAFLGEPREISASVSFEL
jgi:iron complex outermembrane recepter protein